VRAADNRTAGNRTNLPTAACCECSIIECTIMVNLSQIKG
jgi:hypothetical protein